MLAWLQWFAWTWVAVGPNGYEISRQLAAADELERQLLPLTELAAVAGDTYLVFHQRPDLSRAMFLSADAFAELTVGNAWMLLGCERPLVHLQVPRVMLAAGTYRRPDGLLRLREMAVDVMEHYVHALLEARFEQRWPRQSDAIAALAERAHELMTDVPADLRLDAYVSAVVEFGAHLLTMANEVGRHQRKRTAADGESLCPLVVREAALFGLWRRSIEDAPYPGQYTRPRGTGGAYAGEVAISRSVLAPADKRWVIQEFLGAAWTGDPQLDFAVLCS